MAATVSVKVSYDTPYKGGTKRWSNRWHFTGPDWSGSSQFNTFADALKAQINQFTTTRTTIVEMVGYQAGSDLPAFTKSYGTAGTYPIGSDVLLPLEVAGLIRFTTTQRTSKNHPIYLFKYLHDMLAPSGSNREAMHSGQKGTIQGDVNTIMAGLSDGTNTRIPAGPNGAVAQTATVEAQLTHRDFPT